MKKKNRKSKNRTPPYKVVELFKNNDTDKNNALDADEFANALWDLLKLTSNKVREE